MLNDFLAKQPIDVIINTEITDEKVILPNKVDSDSFYKKFQAEIEADELTTEKAIYIASTNKPAEFNTSTQLLNSKVKY